MAYQCPACCGELKQNGSGFKCIYCGSAYASLAEILAIPSYTILEFLKGTAALG